MNDVDFEITEDRADPAFPGEGEGPEITIERNQNHVEITGSFVVGNTCYEARLDSIEYATENSEELVATVEGHKPISIFPRGCDDVAVAQAYRLTFIVDPLPGRITGVEQDAQDGEYSTTISI